MPRYFFHVHDGADLIDHEGTELADLDQARENAVRYAAALLLEIGQPFWDGADWSLEVTDEAGLAQFTLHFLVTDAPAATRPRVDA